MSPSNTVLVVGATGRTGGRVVRQLLARGVRVRAVVRSAARLPAGVASHANFACAEADLLAMPDADLAAQVRGCDAIVSCLGHTITFAGVFGPPRALVTDAVWRLCRAIEASAASAPTKFVLMTSVSVNHPGIAEPRRGALDRFVLSLLRALVPPSADNQNAAEVLHRGIGARHPRIEWVVVRPDSLLEGDVTPYVAHETIVAGLFKPDATNRANVAHFTCELIHDETLWTKWKGKMPVLVNVVAETSANVR